MENYIALLADIRSSREYDDYHRNISQSKLYYIMEFLNNVFSQRMETKFNFSSGDSIQCLFEEKSHAIECAYLLRTLFYPNYIRIGIGIGDINQYMLNNKVLYDYRYNSNALDGQAFHYAIKALDQARLYNYSIVVLSNNPKDDIVVNQLLKNANYERNRLSDARKTILFIYDTISPLLNERELHIYCEHMPGLIRELNRYNEDNFYDSKNPIFSTIGIEYASYIFSEDRIRRIIETRERKKWDNILENEINNRKDDEIVAKLLDVTLQNVSNLRRSGHLNEIRNNELLALYLLSNKKKGLFVND